MWLSSLPKKHARLAIGLSAPAAVEIACSTVEDRAED
jgi:hypothetical protein